MLDKTIINFVTFLVKKIESLVVGRVVNKLPGLALHAGHGGSTSPLTGLGLVRIVLTLFDTFFQ